MAIKERYTYGDFGYKRAISSGHFIDSGPARYESDKLRLSFSGKHGNFDSDSYVVQGGQVYGRAPYWDESFEGYPLPLGTYWFPACEVDEPSTGALSAKLLAQTDPSQPDVDIANFIGELKDLPHMLKSIGDSFLNKGVAYAFGHLNLSYKFGWAPFARDVAAMMDFQRLAAKRFAVLRDLKIKGSRLRRAHLFKGNAETHLSFSQNQFSFETVATAVSDISGYVIWHATETMPDTDEGLHTLAYKQALGLTLRPEVAWNLLPWSWLIDWFSNVGEFLEATRNRTGMEPGIANIVRSRNWKATCVGTVQPWASAYFSGHITPKTRDYTIHERYGAGKPSISAHLPILNMGQVGILASIKATRR